MIINPIGIMVDSLRLGLRDGLKKSKELGADGVQIYAVSGEMDPANLTPRARKELRAYIASLDLQISALCGDLGGHGFQDQTVNAAKIEKSKRILDLAVELGIVRCDDAYRCRARGSERSYLSNDAASL